MHKLFGICFLILNLFSCRQDPVKVEENFRIRNVSAINRIEIESKRYGLQKLQVKNSGWYLNDSIKIRKDAIENILRIVPYVKVMNFPPKAAWDQMSLAMRNEGGTIRFINRSGDEIRSWHIGGTTNDERGTYGMVAGSSKPYVIHVPGFDGSIATRFFMENKEWRSRMILDEVKNSISHLKLVYPETPDSGFEIIQGSGGYILFDRKHIKKVASQELIALYLDQISIIGCESIENDFKYKEIVINTTPHAVMEIAINDKPNRKISFFTNTLEGDADKERMFVYDGKDFYLAQIRILQKIFRPIEFFVVK